MEPTIKWMSPFGSKELIFKIQYYKFSMCPLWTCFNAQQEFIASNTKETKEIVMDTTPAATSDFHLPKRTLTLERHPFLIMVLTSRIIAGPRI